MDIKIRIEKVVSGGLGFSRIDEKVYFVPFTLPGELIFGEIYEDKKEYAFVRVKEIIEKSEKRITPVCPIFGYCGGCQLQMTDYKTQLSIKKDMIEESISRIAKIDIPVMDIVESDKVFNYRNKGSFQVFNGSKIGYCEPGTTDPFPIESCPIMEEPINRRIKEFLTIEEENKKIEGMKALVIRSNFESKIIDSTIKKDWFIENVAGLNFIVDIDTFFQVNRTIIPKWLGHIKDLVLNYKVGKGLLDLYSGVGIISQYLAPYFDHVIGIEINKTLVKNGNKALELNKINNTKFITADASRFYSLGFIYDTVIINPPRKGISYKMIKSLIQSKPKVIIYSSCNPDTFARDIRQLIAGGYSIDYIQGFDMFPNTKHLEVVGVIYLK
ncbi:MAG TPA: class I SAM-dependent RNA methyltransferase [Spirochaetota bacterium]|nr:class I SAM-dependent RNA methyltransferase [Spirochaetota bacterium]HOM38133.1 class I SAM-dependent RNA methyltransferase [Spirochaetota bacterium]HPQ48936.1 class I SAM-dependent RNA methyltransferase [Spirochaetota bacterium]